jgi:hypothetical protein
MPRTEGGKQRSSQNACRHGLTAETAITPFEDPCDYMAFELSGTSDFEAETAVERELVLRLASLLWRLRRTVAIETGLLQLYGEVTLSQLQRQLAAAAVPIFRLQQAEEQIKDVQQGSHEAISLESPGLKLARSFLDLAKSEGEIIPRLSRYEAALWRQVRQTNFTLESSRWPNGRHRHPMPRHRWAHLVR